MLPSLAGGDPEAYGGVLGLVFYLISTAATAITLLVGFIELILHLCGRRSRGWALPLLVSLSAPFFRAPAALCAGRVRRERADAAPCARGGLRRDAAVRPALDALLARPRRAAEPETYDDGYADGDYERGYADEPDDARRRSMATTTIMTIMTSRTAMTIRRSAASATSAIVRPRSTRRSIRRV